MGLCPLEQGNYQTWGNATCLEIQHEGKHALIKGCLMGSCLLSKSLQSKWDSKPWERWSIFPFWWLSMQLGPKGWAPLLGTLSPRLHFQSKEGILPDDVFEASRATKGCSVPHLSPLLCTCALPSRLDLLVGGKSSNAMTLSNQFPTFFPSFSVSAGLMGHLQVLCSSELTSEDLA